ncbi:hypothetical protein L249_4801, partial [Ophiocordyceps polyrhachis-furcata BCC 54312]
MVPPYTLILSLLLLPSTQAFATVPAIWDGECFYPVRDSLFSPAKYGGKWNYIAGTDTPFSSAGCICNITATHTAVGSGNLLFDGACHGGSVTGPKTFVAYAEPAPSGHGASGAYIVDYPGAPKRPCPGPNHVVLDCVGGMAVVGTGNFSSIYLLSREADLDKFTLE